MGTDANPSATTQQRPTPAESSDSFRLLIIGAGPFGLAMAAQAKELGVDYEMIGRPMSFWKRHMPAGMLLRSGCEWHLDPAGRDTIERFAQVRGKTPDDVEPLSLDFYLDYAEWFQQEKGIRARPSQVVRLDGDEGRFTALLDDGGVVTADNVLLAVGFAPFAHVPDDLAALIPAERSSHACNLATPVDFAAKRVLIVGGRQSAFESAALLAEAGAADVHICHRHATPAFTTSDWSWVGPLLERMVDEPGWYRSLPEKQRRELNDRFWSEGRLKLEPWLAPRVHREPIAVRPSTNIVGCEQLQDALRMQLDAGDRVDVDHVLYATGYRVDLQRVPLLKAGNLIDRIECRDGFPVLDESMQSSVPGLFITSLPATRDFGLFFAFTAAVRASAHIVGRSLPRR